MTALGWAFMALAWGVIFLVTGWCYRLVLGPKAQPHETKLPPSGRM
jgi:hypothetical protein